MALILCIETTTTNCSVALAKDGKTIFLKEDMGLKYSHAERLHSYIADLLQEAMIPMKQLDAIAISEGPGSYTGLRIGVSSAKGLCYALEKPLIAIDTLAVLASQANLETPLVIPLLDARRMEVYSAVFSEAGEKLRETQAEILEAESFLTYLDTASITFIGNGAAKFAEICEHSNANFITEALPSAREMSGFAEAKFKAKDFEDVAYFEPFYLKDFLIQKKA